MSSEDIIDNFFQNDKELREEEIQGEKEEEEEIIIVGIDLGTTNSCIGIWRNNNLEIIPDKLGNHTIPSIVSFTNKSRYVGHEAKNQLEINPENSYYEVKRLIGRKYSEQEVQLDLPFFGFTIEPDKDDNILIKSTLESRKEYYTPEEISSLILLELKNMAEDYLKKKISKAVITVPAYFNDSQRQATKDAATIAGLECVRIINEPTSSSLAYGIQHLSKKQKNQEFNILAYDLGGGTLDCSILRVSNSFFEVLASSGNKHLGGSDFDNRLVNYCITEFKRKNNLENLDKLNISSINFQKLRSACESCKKILSTQLKHTIVVKDFLAENLAENLVTKNLVIPITREKFENLCKDLFILCIKSVDDVLTSANLDKRDINDIILVGGATRMPRITENIRLYFNKEPNSTVNPDEAVCAGAAVQAYILSHNNDPFAESITLLDVIPLSLGIETIDGVMCILIPRNSTIPVKRKKKFTTASDYDTSINVKIYEGERHLTKDNYLVGEFKLDNIEKSIRGNAIIEITFTIDINGIVNVTAEDLKSKDKVNKSNITITGNKGRLTTEQINNLVQEAKEEEGKDKKEKEKRFLLYEIEEMCSNIKLNLQNKDFNIREVDKTDILTNIKNIEEELIRNLDTSIKELSIILENIKRKYSTLILKVITCNEEINKLDTLVENKTGTNIYGDDENIDNLEVVVNEVEVEVDLEVDEIKEIRLDLLNLCNNLISINYSNIEIDNKDEYIKNLKDTIDDILIWAHVKEKITLIEYKQKIAELNSMSNINFVIKKKIKDELEQLCYILKSSIHSNILVLDETSLLNLETKIDETLDWLTENKNLDDIIYQSKLDEINIMCNELVNIKES